MRLLLVLFVIAGCGKSDRAAQPAPAPSHVAEAGAAAVDATPADAPPAGDAAVVADALDIDAARVTEVTPAPRDGFLLATSRAKPGEVLVASFGDLTKGTRWALYDEKGRVCTASIGDALDCGDTPAAQLADVDGDCTTAMYGVAVDEKLAVTKVRPAPAPVDRATREAYGADEQRMADSKAAVEGGSPETVANHTSTRVLERADHDSLVLGYGTIRYDRTIVVYALAGPPEQPELRELHKLEAPAPSRVLGVSIDGDRALDAVIAHDGGAVLVTGARKTLELVCKR